ncbi:glypican-5 isoform X1 [Tachysurus ichikawai]
MSRHSGWMWQRISHIKCTKFSGYVNKVLNYVNKAIPGNNVIRYKGRVVGNGVLAQRQNPEVRVRGPDAILAAVKERLQHFNQEIQQHMPGMGQRDSWDLGSGEDSSGECDDEDGCQGSGEGTTKSCE